MLHEQMWHCKVAMNVRKAKPIWLLNPGLSAVAVHLIAHVSQFVAHWPAHRFSIRRQQQSSLGSLPTSFVCAQVHLLHV